MGRFRVVDAAALAAHYGSVSAVTFTAALTFAESAGSRPSGILPALVALLEVPGIVIALGIAQKLKGGIKTGEAIREVVAGKSVLLLLGGLRSARPVAPKAWQRSRPCSSISSAAC